MAITFEPEPSASAPLVLTFLGVRVADVLAAYFARVDAWCEGRRQYAVILDFSRCEPPSVIVRAWMVREMNARQPFSARLCVAMTIVPATSSPRDAGSAAPWARPTGYPQRIVATRGEGREVCAAWAARHRAGRRPVGRAAWSTVTMLAPLRSVEN
jgi:hypothetical protein